jgi:hypothetical protein
MADTFLSLARTLREDCGISGAENTPSTVIGQTGEMRRVVNWVKRAYREVQEKRSDWEFLRNDFSFSTIAGTQTYTRAAISLTSVLRWKVDTFRCYRTSTGTTDEQWLTYVPWAAFRDRFLMSANRTLQSRAEFFTVKPDKSIMFWPIPDAAYTIVGEAWNAPDTFAVDADESVIPEECKDVILGKGMTYYAAYEAAPEVAVDGQERFDNAYTTLERDYTPPIEMGEAIA